MEDNEHTTGSVPRPSARRNRQLRAGAASVALLAAYFVAPGVAGAVDEPVPTDELVEVEVPDAEVPEEGEGGEVPDAEVPEEGEEGEVPDAEVPEEGEPEASDGPEVADLELEADEDDDGIDDDEDDDDESPVVSVGGVSYAVPAVGSAASDTPLRAQPTFTG